MSVLVRPDCKFVALFDSVVRSVNDKGEVTGYILNVLPQGGQFSLEIDQAFYENCPYKEDDEVLVTCKIKSKSGKYRLHSPSLSPVTDEEASQIGSGVIIGDFLLCQDMFRTSEGLGVKQVRVTAAGFETKLRESELFDELEKHGGRLTRRCILDFGFETRWRQMGANKYQAIEPVVSRIRFLPLKAKRTSEDAK